MGCKCCAATTVALYLFRISGSPESPFCPLPIVSIVVPFLVNQNLYSRILTINWLTKKGTTMETLGMILHHEPGLV